MESIKVIAGASEQESSAFLNSIAGYDSQLSNLRADGVTKIENLNVEILKIKRNKNYSKEDKESLIAKDKEQIKAASEVVKANKAQVAEIQGEAVRVTKEFYKKAAPAAKEDWANRIAKIKEEHANKVAEIVAQNQKAMAEIEAIKPADNNDEAAVTLYENKLKTQKSFFNQARFEENTQYKAKLQVIKNEKHAHFLQQYHLLASIRNGRNTPVELVEAKVENYLYQFDPKNFFIKNGLYLVLLLFMIICVSLAPNVLSINSIMLILKNFSYKVFYALGVAGLILLAGTDLSVGRMVTLGTLITCMILNPNTSTMFFGLNFSNIYKAGLGVALIVALLLSVIFCTLFSAIAGFFSAKFKIHPFISTLATQLVIWGICVVATKAVKTGSISSAAAQVSMMIGQTRSFNGFPIIFIYAAITILIVSFLWNKTKFGKYLYAVGGNPDAASVSGISVFWVTIGAFIMAGVLYGLGGFVTGTTFGSSDSAFGQGWEMEAIAACVVGGISFMGGIGKVSGAVIGCLIFEMLKFFLNGVLSKYQASNSTDIANIFIGVIILTAVTFDSLKYLKKK